MDGVTLWAVAAPGSGGFQAAVDETSMGQQCALMSSGLSPRDSETASSFLLWRKLDIKFPYFIAYKHLHSFILMFLTFFSLRQCFTAA